MAFSLFPDERPVVISPPLKGAPPIFMPPCSITSLDNPNTNKLESFRSFNLYSRRDTPLPDASLFQDFLRRNCTSLPADEPLTTGAVLSHLAHHIQDLDFWRRMTMELLDIVVATAPSPPSNSSCAGTSCEAPKRGRKRSSVVLPREHVTLRPDESPALLRSPTAMLAKAVVGEEADDGSFTINQHVILLPLGHGAQGEVLLAMDTTRNELRAIKAIQRPKGIPEVASGGDTLVTRGALGAAKAARRSQLEREINIMKRCRHRNIVALHEVIDDPELDVMYLVMQYVEKGPIAKLRPDWTIECPIDPVKLAGYTVQMCAGLAYLHRKGVIHRDIKPDNVLIGNHDDVYLADFGTADLFQTDQSKRISDHRGTAAFMAPEMFAVAADGDSSSSAQGELIDIWALGITLFVLLYGKLPWQSVSPRELRHEVSKAELTFPSPATQRKKMTVPEDDGQPYSQDDPLNDVPRLESSQSLPTFLTVEALDDENGVELPSFSCDVTMHSSFSTGDAISPMSRTVNNLRLTAAQHRRRVAVQDASSMWAALLAGILQKDPARRLSLASISSQAQEIIDHHNSGSSAHQGSMGRSGSTSMRADGSDNAEPITRRQHHSS